jgi:SAM-dependent MidA family methyltransferase
VTLRSVIEQEIRQRGPLPFSRYMELCLYHPELGYYTRNAGQFGKAGDFYTSSDVHAVFGRLLARQFDEMWRALGSPGRIEVVELGPGRGLFARDVLDWSEKKFPEFFAALQYRLVEGSPALRSRLQASLGEHIEKGKASIVDLEGSSAAAEAVSSAAQHGTTKVVPSQLDRSSGTSGVHDGAPRPNSDLHDDAAGPNSGVRGGPAGRNWEGTPSGVPVLASSGAALAAAGSGYELPANTIVFANEFFDALPVEVLSDQGELRIDVRDGRFVETWAPASPQELEYLDRYAVHPEPGERVEALLVAQDYMQWVTAATKRGFLIAIDYGYTRGELLAGRHRGTIMTYRQHSASPNPYEAPGEQDITAHVNFTALAAAAEQNGMQSYKLLTQSQFLMGIGEQTQFADAFEDCRLPQERAKVALQLKHLVTPAGMGETFQVFLASKAVDAAAVSNLSGLAFGRNL